MVYGNSNHIHINAKDTNSITPNRKPDNSNRIFKNKAVEDWDTILPSWDLSRRAI